MTRFARSFCAAVALLASAASAFGQSAILQGGPWVPGHSPMYVGSGSSQPIVQDSGPASGGAIGLGLAEQLLTVRSPTSTYPAASAGSGQFGTNWCDYDAPITNATGYHFLCMSPNAAGGGLIAYGAGGGASTLPFNLNINGTNYQFPFVVGGIVGPSTTVVGDLALWNNTNGTLLKDLATANNSSLITSGGGTVSWSQTLPTAVQSNITALGTIGAGVWNGTPILGSFIGSGTITSSNIAAGTITGSNIAASTVTGSNIASTTVTTANLAASAVTNAKLATMGASTIKCNSTNATANPQDCTLGQGLNFVTSTVLQDETGFVRVWPSAGQSSSSPWNATDPHGNAINCSGTTTQCVNEALAAGANNGWPVEINCVGKLPSGATPVPITATSTITIPAGFGLHVTMKECYINNTTSSPVVLVDSQDGSEIWLQIFPNPGAGKDAVWIKPTTFTASLGGAHILNSSIYVESAPATGSGIGCLIDSTNGAITGNSIWCQDPNGGAVGIRVNVSAATPFIVEENKFYFRYVHNHTTAGVQGMTSNATVGFCRKNTWYAGRVSPNGATDGFSTWCTNDTVIGLSVSDEEGAVTNGIHLQSGSTGMTFVTPSVLNATAGVKIEANSSRNSFLGINVTGGTTGILMAGTRNTFSGGNVSGAGTAKSDSGGGNLLYNVTGVSNAVTTAGLVVCDASTEGLMQAVTDATANTWGTGVGGGGANHVLAFCNGTAWTIAGK